MGTQQTNDDGAMGLPLGQDSDWAPCDRCGQSCVSFGDGLCIGCRMAPLKAANAEVEDAEPFDEATGPMGHVLPGGYVMPSKVPAVIRDEQRMADLFAECAKAVAALRGGVEMLDEVAKGMKDQPRFRTSLLMEAAADSLETAIARANGGAA